MKYIIDPVHGFISIDSPLAETLIKHPVMQRLTRIRQLGVEGMVYPGAQHTRFQHSLGAYHLTKGAINTLVMKGTDITDKERQGIKAAILLHDVGHGPFSHVLENTIVPHVSHEHISAMIMQRLNKELEGELETAISIFTDKYPKTFLHELISSQLDMDRLDYLCRDSFFTGVREGNVGAARILQMLNVKNDHVAIDEKGIYSVENYLMTRRMMYWQVYFHKTAIAAETVLVNAIRRARLLFHNGCKLFASPALTFFLSHDVSREDFENTPEMLNDYLELDDNDIISALKVWRKSNDKILATLSEDFINRRLFKAEIHDGNNCEERFEELKAATAKRMGITESEAEWFVSKQTIEKDMYSMQSDQIRVLMRSGEVRTMPEVSEIIRNDAASPAHRKTIIVYQRT